VSTFARELSHLHLPSKARMEAHYGDFSRWNKHVRRGGRRRRRRRRHRFYLNGWLVVLGKARLDTRVALPKLCSTEAEGGGNA
jgi:hypothetical protein